MQYADEQSMQYMQIYAVHACIHMQQSNDIYAVE